MRRGRLPSAERIEAHSLETYETALHRRFLQGRAAIRVSLDILNLRC